MIAEDPPIRGTVIRFSYLWKKEADQGQAEGQKDRPAVLLVSHSHVTDECIVVPITHSPPYDPAKAVELPAAECLRLGLDADRCWVVLDEYNVFTWPGPDLRAVPGKEPVTATYGKLSRGTFEKILGLAQTLLRAKLARRVPRRRPTSPS